MKYLLITFKSRNSLYGFMNKLKNYNIESKIINTPSGISRSCSLSIKTSILFSNSIINILSQSNYNDLIGVFSVETFGFNERINRLY